MFFRAIPKQGGPMALTNVTVDLSGTWQVVNTNGSINTQGIPLFSHFPHHHHHHYVITHVITGTVPGQIHTDLMAAKIIGDPYHINF